MNRLRELWQTPRVRLWALLVLFLLGAIALLLVAQASKRGAPLPPPGPIEVRLVGPDGSRLEGAEVHLKRPEGAGLGEGVSWAPEAGLLTLPRAGAPHAFAATAPGMRVLHAEGVLESQTLALRPAHVVRLRMSADVPPPDLPLMIVLKVAPGEELAKAEKLDLLPLMAIRDLERRTTPPLPRQGFGFAVSQQDAAAGVLLPVAGTYVVTWGLFDAKAGTWFALADGSRTEIAVQAKDEVEVFEVPLTAELLEQTKRGLEEQIRRLKGE